MVKYVVLVVGVIFVILGIWGVVVWWPDFLTVLKGGGTPFLAFIGAIMAIAAVSEIRDAIARKREEEKEKQQEQEQAQEEQKQG
ncbi:MAG TPA: hypothetical protein ENF60_00540 [Candidatus Omnitrophica bacterium]|nr:hypothetical protein [Candidatus Omnitrophota bacterium]